MRSRLLALILPAAAAGLLLGATAVGKKLGFIPPELWPHLWPWLVAVLYLVLAMGAVMLRRPIWIWPPLVAFLVQVLCIVLWYTDVILSTGKLLTWPLATFVVLTFVWGLVWLVVFLRSRRLELGLTRGMGVERVDAEKLRMIRQEMADALKTLQRAGRGRNAIYELPWCLVVGRPAAGKTVAIKNSELGLPVRKDWVKGVGGTFTANWFFTNQLIFVDTPGAWVEKGVTEEGERLWDELLGLLRRYRGRQPLDGLIVVVPADDLLGKSRQELIQQAGNIRDVIDLIQDKLRFRFPVYVLVSKTDLVEGFVDFFKGLPAKRRHQIFGFSHPDPNEPPSAREVRRSFGRLLRQLQAARLEILARTPFARAVQRLFFFTEEFNRLEEPLVDFTETLFQEDPSHDTPVFRGIYFTSGTQGEGVPLGAALADLARKLGIRSAAPAATEDEPKRSYFLKDLFREVMVQDEGLVGRTAWHWWQRRRDTVLAAFLPAALVWLLVGLATVSYLLNKRLYHQAAAAIPALASDVRDAPDMLAKLHKTGEIYAWLDRIGFAPHRALFMRRADGLHEQIDRIFREQLMANVMRPTLAAAQAYALDRENNSLSERADALHAAVWLRSGARTVGENDLRVLERLWTDLGAQEVDEARDLLATQAGYLARNVDRAEDSRRLLVGIDLPAVAESLAGEVEQVPDAGSAFDSYVKFQESCYTPRGAQIVECYEKLGAIARFSQAEAARLRATIDTLVRDLPEIDEPGADEAAGQLRRVAEGLFKQKSTCAEKFEETVVRFLGDYHGRQAELIEQCKREASPREATAKVNEQEQGLKENKSNIVAKLREFARDPECAVFVARARALEAQPIFETAERYRRIECSGEVLRPSMRETASRDADPGPGDLPARKPEAARSPRSAFTHFKVPARWPAGATSEDWRRLREELVVELNEAKQLDPDEHEAKRSEVRESVLSYARRFQRGWEEFYRAVELTPPVAAPAEALRAIASSDELAKLLKPAAEAVAAAGLESEFPDFRVVAEGLGVRQFAENDLPQYHRMLRAVADDLERCENPAVLRAYRLAANERDPANPLIGALNWVDDHGGATLASGALRPLLRRPFEDAQLYLNNSGSDLIQGQYSTLVSQWRGIAARFPFAGMESDGLVDEPEVRAFLGEATGSVPSLRDLFAQGEMPPSFARALDLSSVFFAPGTDSLRPLRLKLVVKTEDATLAPEDIDTANWRLESFAFDFGDDQIAWKAGEDATKAAEVTTHLFGPEALAGGSEIKIAVGKKKTLGMVPGVAPWGPRPPQQAAKADGYWSILRVLAQGEVLGREGNLVKLGYTVPFDYKKKGDGRVTVVVEASGTGLPKLLDLLKEPLGAPPELPAS